jgi:hypothetical protein
VREWPPGVRFGRPPQGRRPSESVGPGMPPGWPVSAAQLSSTAAPMGAGFEHRSRSVAKSDRQHPVRSDPRHQDGHSAARGAGRHRRADSRYPPSSRRSIRPPALARTAAIQGTTDLRLRLGDLAAPTTASRPRELAAPTQTGQFACQIDNFKVAIEHRCAPRLR